MVYSQPLPDSKQQPQESTERELDRVGVCVPQIVPADVVMDMRPYQKLNWVIVRVYTVGSHCILLPLSQSYIFFRVPFVDKTMAELSLLGPPCESIVLFLLLFLKIH